ncbi:hypothetical protein JRO89_XS01G0220900 [Xanthoceras sorbifolium]|uniref:Uncharacterized protein n=1 Tax=Xanthoceras sorbifolium TaxID=99658 RepID=A0ABQ8IKI7_9ROSI|nr:hypothetical protein JRO89_XS01G0220900 [Xanthoceras sorbifolium]
MGNSFSGSIPESIGNLSSLEEFYLSENGMKGTIPVMPTTIKFSDQAIVFLNYNRFTGPLPVLSSNVSSFYLDNNLFSGPIPEDIGEQMPMLTDVGLSFNSLNGTIPLSMGKLNSLLTLVLSNNHFTGKIPDFWNNIPDVYVIDMSNNSLSANQFQTLTDPSIYEGNPALCGSPLPNSCNKEKETSHFPSSQKKDDEDEDFYAKPLFYSSIVLGFILGFWGVCGTLIVKNSWRVAYFRFVDDMKDRLLLVVSLRLARLRRLAKGEGNQGSLFLIRMTYGSMTMTPTNANVLDM